MHHVSHETHHPHNTQFSSPVTVHHVAHQSGSVAALSNKRTVRVVTKAAPNYSLTVRYGKVILAPYDPTDEYQVMSLPQNIHFTQNLFIYLFFG